MPSLVLAEAAVAAPNTGTHTLAAAVLAGKPLLVAATGARVSLLDEECRLVRELSFEEAFGGVAEGSRVKAVAMDVAAGRIAAVSEGRVAVWAQRGAGWRVHSTFRVPHAVVALDFVNGKIAAAGDGLTLWELREAGAFPVWSRIGSLSLPQPIALARLSPSAGVLAVVAKASSTVMLHSVLPQTAASSSSGAEQRLEFRSRAAHSSRVRSISWRPSDDVADSGPVLFTLTTHGAFHIWGSMIDEPSFFSLWATLDVHSSAPKQLALSTLYWRTTPMEESEGPTAGTQDQFVTVFADGSVGLTTLSNFDSRPPTCLTQSTSILQTAVFGLPTHLASLRYSFLLPSSSPSAPSFHLIGRSARSTLVYAKAILSPPVSTLTTSKNVFPESPHSPLVSVVGRVKKLVRSRRGHAVVAVGEEHLQCWDIGADGFATETRIAELDFLEGEIGLTTWHNGRMIAIASNDTLRIIELRPSGPPRLAASTPIHTSDLHGEAIFASPLAFFAARSSFDSLATTLIYVSRSGIVRTFVYSAATRTLSTSQDPSVDLRSPLSAGATVVLAEPLPPPLHGDRNAVKLLVVDSDGVAYRWSRALGTDDSTWSLSEQGEGRAGMKTGLDGIEKVAVAHDGTSAMASASSAGKSLLSIWDPKAGEFSTGRQFEQEFDDIILGLSWSLDNRVLAVVTATGVELYCAQRLDDLSGASSWSTVATLRASNTLPVPISAASWLSSGISISALDHVYFYSQELDTGGDLHEHAEEQIAPLPLHHPQLLFQAILQGHFDVVVQILANLARELTDEGYLTPLPRTDDDGRVKKERLTLETFLAVPGALERKVSDVKVKKEDDLFTALTSSSTRSSVHDFPSSAKALLTVRTSSSDSTRIRITEDDLSRLLAAIRRRLLRGLSNIEHEHLAVLAQTVFETQSRRSSLDENGLRFLVSLRSHYFYRSASTPADLKSTTAALNGPNIPQRLKYRDMLWAFHSESQDLLLEEATKACGGKLTWANARTLGVALWLKSPDTLHRTLETVGRTEFTRPDEEDRDPISAMLFYLALKKPHVVQTFWKQSTGHGDQRQMLKFLANDFSEQRWKSAALKNAFALMSKQRFLFAAAFFLLGNSLKDAVSVILRQLDDFQLAIAMARVYEGGEDGPVLRFILEESVIPLAFRKGYRWLGSWAFWVLGRRDLAVQVIITPLSELASKLPYRLDIVSSRAREDPALVLLFAQLRSWSLQTVKGAIGVSGRTEFNFVLHISRILCRMGCHVLALRLLQSWRFLPPAPPSTASRRPNPLENRRHSLLLSSTKLDLPLPASNIPSRVASPAPLGASADDSAERERQRQQFRDVVKQVKVEAKAPAEFSFDAFVF
ncbi:hypothetical protein JCM10213_003434 [Rhodosporidiobolus nylandii]